MRSDMHKVITEPPRYGNGYYHTEPNDYRQAKVFKLTDDGEVIDDFGFREPMKSKKIGWDSKKHNPGFLWGVAKRFLIKNLNRRWDDIYSEIARACKTEAAKAQDLKHILTNNVETHTFVGDDGRIYYTSSYMRWSDYKDAAGCVEEEHNIFYVDPRDGTLKRSPSKSYKQQSKARSIERHNETIKTHREFADGRKFELVDSVWFELVRENQVYTSYKYGDPYEVDNWVDVKRTASKKTIRDYKLNQPAV